MRQLLHTGPRTYLMWSFAFSYALWIGAWILAASSGTELLLNEHLVRAVVFAREEVGLPSLLALLAVYGPLLGGWIATRADPELALADLRSRVTKVRVSGRWYAYASLVLAVTWLPPFIALLVANGGTFRGGLAVEQVLAFLGAFLVFQLSTSGLEEVGWRGYLLEKGLAGRSLWDAGWFVGIPWALWHFPILVFMFLRQGVTGPALVGSLAGFSIGIVGMSILHAWFYSNTRSVFLAIVIHASFNTFPLATGLLFESSYAAALASQLLLWAVVIFILRREEGRAVPLEAA